jgi:hypothetical protein
LASRFFLLLRRAVPLVLRPLIFVMVRVISDGFQGGVATSERSVELLLLLYCLIGCLSREKREDRGYIQYPESQ